MLRPWHGCLRHNRNHCPKCQACDCFDPPEKENTINIDTATHPDVTDVVTET